MLIRKTVKKDISQLAVLIEELGYSTAPGEMASRFSKISSNPLYNTLVAEKKGVIVGMIGMMLGFHYEKNDNYVRIVALVVDTQYRKQGIGEKLVKKLWGGQRNKGRAQLH